MEDLQQILLIMLQCHQTGNAVDFGDLTYAGYRMDGDCSSNKWNISWVVMIPLNILEIIFEFITIINNRKCALDFGDLTMQNKS